MHVCGQREVLLTRCSRRGWNLNLVLRMEWVFHMSLTEGWGILDQGNLARGDKEAGM